MRAGSRKSCGKTAPDGTSPARASAAMTHAARWTAVALTGTNAYGNFKREFENARAGQVCMTRPSDITRERIMRAAERLFAERGYDATSVRAIVAKARVNQAAINYHFDGKDG